jgi:ThiF family
MFQKLVSHNQDIKRLIEKGYAVAFDSNYLIVRDIPYLDATGALQVGAFVAKIIFVDQERIQQDDHQIYFAGTVPHNIDGTPVANLGGGEATFALSEACADVVIQRSFSNKPIQTGRYEDFFEKVESYTGLIAGPAIEKYGANPLTFRTVEQFDNDPIFKFQDTLTSRAEIGNLSSQFHQEIVAIIGLGGTGGYVLDYLCKSPVKEIRAYDADEYHVHNAFRSPGQLNEDELGTSKAAVYQGRYENFRYGLRCETKFVDTECEADFRDVTFAFVCVDNGQARGEIYALLIGLGIPFIDVGMGLKLRGDALSGMLRTTYYSPSDGPVVRDLGLAETTENPDNLYRSNIQIAELNALNAGLAVLRYKQLMGFYVEEAPFFHHLFNIDDMSGTGESELNALQAATG